VACSPGRVRTRARAAGNSCDRDRQVRPALGDHGDDLRCSSLTLVRPSFLPDANHETGRRATQDLSAVATVFPDRGIVLFLFLLIGTLSLGGNEALFGFASLLVGAWLLQIRPSYILGIAYVRPRGGSS